MIIPFIAFVLVFSSLVLIHELGHFIMAKLAGIRVEEFGFGFPPRLLTIMKRNGTEYTINAIPFGGFVRLLGEEAPSQPGSFASKSKLVRTITLAAGSMMNLFLATVLFSLSFALGWPTATDYEVVVTGVTANSPAEAVGIKEGDVVLKADDLLIEKAQDLSDYTHTKLGQVITLLVNREGKPFSFSVTPRLSWPEGDGPIGVEIGTRVAKIEIISHRWWGAIWLGLQKTVGFILFTFYIPVLIMRGLIPLELARPIGPVGMAQMTGEAALQIAARGWWFPILGITASLSTALGVANVLPLPGLDGGRLFFVALEALRGKRVDPEKEAFVHMLGIALLLTLMLIITYYDIISPLPSFDWDSLDFLLRK